MRLWKKLSIGFVLLLLLVAGAGTYIGWSISTPLSDADRLALTKSPQFHEGGFVNIEPQAAFELSLKSLREAFSGDERATPTGKIPVMSLPVESLQSQAAAGLRLAWLGHASVLIELDGKRILTDPVLSQRVSPFSFVGPKRFHDSPIRLDDLRGIDAVVISHNHYDHLDEATIRHLSKQKTRFYLPLGNKSQLMAWDVPENQIEELDWWQERQLGDVKIVATPTRHYSNRGTFDYKQTLWTSWTILGPKNRVFYSGDTGYSSAFKTIGTRFGPFDATIIKVGSYGPGESWHNVHMPPEESVQVHLDVQGKAMLPVHWGTFNLAYHAWDEPIIRSVAAARAKQVNLLTPKIGEIIEPRYKTHFPFWWENVDRR